MICGPVLCPGRAPDWDRLHSGRCRPVRELGVQTPPNARGRRRRYFQRSRTALRKEDKRGCMPMEMDTTDLIARARAGDHNAFRDLVQGHSHELQVHCYRILGSLQDAEDALQETLVSAWRNLGDFGQRSSLGTWLYKIASNRCLSMLRADSRRPRIAPPVREAALPEPTGAGDAPPWLEPYPDVLLDPAPEVTQMLGTTQEAVNSALKRARATVDNHLADSSSTDSSSTDS